MLSEKAKEARRKYRREYYAAHKEQERKRIEDYWERRAERMEVCNDSGNSEDR